MISSDKPLLIILEGPDKVGKSTIYQLLRRATNYEPLVIDRFTGSNWVYDQYYARNTDLKAYLEQEAFLTEGFNVVLFIFRCDAEVLHKRIEVGEEGVDREIAHKNINEVTGLYVDYFNVSRYMNKVFLDTTEASAKGTVHEMLNFIGGLGYDTDNWVARLRKVGSD